MEQYPYQLAKYKTPADRLTCPQCGVKRAYAAYVDNATGQPLGDGCGRCNRAEQCGYHLPPRGWFGLHPDQRPSGKNTTPIPRPPDKRTMYIPDSTYLPSLDARFRPKNQFFRYLVSEFGERAAHDAFDAYRLGTSNHYGGGSTLFPLMDGAGCVSGQIIKTEPVRGKTVRFAGGKRATTWLHVVADLGSDYKGNADKFPFPFGMHLTIADPSATCCIVESAKTAVAMSCLMPEYTWLAIGSLDWLNPARLQQLKGRTIILVPDGGQGAEKWREKLPFLRRHGHRVDVVDMGLPPGDDVADLLPAVTRADTVYVQPLPGYAERKQAAEQQAATAPETALGGTQEAGQPDTLPLAWEAVDSLYDAGLWSDTEIEKVALAAGYTFEQVEPHFAYQCRGEGSDGKLHYWYRFPIPVQQVQPVLPTQRLQAA